MNEEEYPEFYEDYEDCAEPNAEYQSDAEQSQEPPAQPNTEAAAAGTENKSPSPVYKFPHFIVYIILIVIITAVFSANITLHNRNKNLISLLKEERKSSDKLSDIISEKDNEINEIEEREKEDKEKADFLDKNIAIIIDADNSNVYHRYGCPTFKGNSLKFYWACNTINAEYLGYTKCKECHTED